MAFLRAIQVIVLCIYLIFALPTFPLLIYCISVVFFLSSLPYYIKSPSSLFSVSLKHLFPFSPRIDGDGIIKVADFGLAVEEVNSKGYFRQDKSDCVRLPFKWMALESLQEGVFTTKTDVVRF
jgi:hypothetical protein